jgi:hypothetical protein
MANGVSDLERGIAAALPSSPALTPEGILSFAKDNPATVATGALSLLDIAGGLGRLGGISTPIGILANIGKGLISGDSRDFLPFGRQLFPTEEERAAKELSDLMGGLESAQPDLTPSQKNAILTDYARNYVDPGTLQNLLGPDSLVSPANQTPTTTGGLPPVSPVQTQPLGPPTPAPAGVASLGSPFAGPGVGVFGTPSYTDEADVFGESSPYGGMGPPDGGDDGDDGMDGDLTGGYGVGGI